MYIIFNKHYFLINDSLLAFIPVSVETGLVLLDGKLFVSNAANDVTEIADSKPRLQDRLRVEEDKLLFASPPSSKPKRVYKSFCDPFLSEGFWFDLIVLLSSSAYK